ncbi:ribonuclease catalytic domain-containing protein [Oceanidesulfovibrio indonesiensis]|nr:ribonuclease catalytic domain-containing protein [Oceanidesulfovibrio indonesiensis]
MSGSTVRHPVPGCVVEFMQANRPHIAFVVGEKSGRLKLLTLNSREMNHKQDRLLPWIGPRYAPDLSRQEVLDLLAGHEERRAKIESEVDAMYLWSFAQGEVPSAGVEWFADLLWDGDEASDVDHLAALGRALLGCKTHFKLDPPVFLIHPEEKVEARLREQKIAEEREKLAAAGRSFFKQLWDARQRSGAVPVKDAGVWAAELGLELEQRLAGLLRTRIANPEDQESDQVWKVVSKGLPEVPHLPLLLAQAWGIIPAHYNFHLDQNDYRADDGWWTEYETVVHGLTERIKAEAQAAEEGMDAERLADRLVSVDAATTRDLDDAFAIRPLEGGGWRVLVALACPAMFWPWCSELDRAVAYRASSLYLPEGSSHMMPEVLGTDIFSLCEKTPRPALLVDCEVDARGRLVSCRPEAAWARVTANMTYDEAEDAIDAGAGDHGANLAIGYELAEALRMARIQNGAAVIIRHEPEIELEGEGADTRVQLVFKPQTPKSQLLVSELMIMVNSALGSWAAEHSIPLYYRTQNIALPKESAGVWEAPHEVYRVVRSLGPSCLETRPARHATLGTEAYSPVSSPLRRYADLVNEGQILHYLEHGTPRLTAGEMEAMLPTLTCRMEAVGRIQRFRPRYWKLLAVKQSINPTYDSEIVDEAPNFVTAAVPDLQIFVRGSKKMFGDKIVPGQHFDIRLGKVDPLANEIHVVEAWESEGPDTNGSE